MAPQSAQQTRPTSGDLRNYDINFKGPVAPEEWPDQHRHHFQVIRDIWAMRFDEYKRSHITEAEFWHRNECILQLCDGARSLRRNFDANEATWRDRLEPHIFHRFQKRTMCMHCGKEKWKSDFWAEASTPEERQSLQRKRARRLDCICAQTDPSVERELRGNTLDESDEEESSDTVFETTCDDVVLHDPGDGLRKTSVPMRPDKVVGMKLTHRCLRYISSCPTSITHCPLQRPETLYPFLVVEAKREHKAPGFRAVEAQTAFPLRRFLKLQKDLGDACGIPFDPLVWFYAYQGEEWRVYAGTMADSKVEIFDLWHGNLESEDGAFQIFLITDYIWTWARDIHRRQIQRCLRGDNQHSDETPPPTIEPLDPLESHISSESAQAPDQMGENATQEDGDVAMGIMSPSVVNVSYMNAHPFKWAAFRHNVPTWARQTTMRHSDTILFSFHVLHIPEVEDDFRMLLFSSLRRDENQDSMMRLISMTNQRQNSVLLTRDDILELEIEWTNADIVMSHASRATNSKNLIRAFFFYRTSFQEKNWQIRRQVYCLTWSERATRLLRKYSGTNSDIQGEFEPSQCTDRSIMSRLFSHMQGKFGRESVIMALDDTVHVLRSSDHPSPNGSQLNWVKQVDHEADDASISQFGAMFQATQREASMSKLYYRENTNLLRIFRSGPAAIVPSNNLHLEDVNVGKGAMLIVKPDKWPSDCPRFCLFLMSLEGSTDKAHLGRLLDGTISEAYLVAGEQWRSSTANWTIIRKWTSYLQDGSA